MDCWSRLGMSLLVLAVLSLFAATAWAGETTLASFIDDLSPENVDPPAVRVRETGASEWSRALKGMDLRPGDSVKVSGGGTATLKVGGVAIVHLEPNSVFTIPETEENAERVSTVTLEQGGLWATVKKNLTSGEGFSVQTKNAIGGVKGTQFRVDQTAGGDSDFEMLEGELELRGLGADQTPVRLKAGQMFGFRKGGVRKSRGPQVLRRIGKLREAFRDRFGGAPPSADAVPALLRRRVPIREWRRFAPSIPRPRRFGPNAPPRTRPGPGGRPGTRSPGLDAPPRAPAWRRRSSTDGRPAGHPEDRGGQERRGLGPALGLPAKGAARPGFPPPATFISDSGRVRQVRTELDQLVRKRELLLSARRQFLSNTTTSRKTTGTIADWATAARQNDARFMLFAREIGTLKVRYQGRLNTKDPRQDVFRRNLDRAWGTVRAALDKPLADGSILSRLRDWSGNNSNTSPPDSSPVRRKLWTSR